MFPKRCRGRSWLRAGRSVCRLSAFCEAEGNGKKRSTLHSPSLSLSLSLSLPESSLHSHCLNSPRPLAPPPPPPPRHPAAARPYPKRPRGRGDSATPSAYTSDFLATFGDSRSQGECIVVSIRFQGRTGFHLVGNISKIGPTSLTIFKERTRWHVVYPPLSTPSSKRNSFPASLPCLPPSRPRLPSSSISPPSLVRVSPLFPVQIDAGSKQVFKGQLACHTHVAASPRISFVRFVVAWLLASCFSPQSASAAICCSRGYTFKVCLHYRFAALTMLNLIQRHGNNGHTFPFNMVSGVTS